MAPWSQRQTDGKAVVWATLEGFFWFPRTLMGFVKLMYAFIEDPELIHAINRDLLQFNLGLLDQIDKACKPTFITLAEDMSFNNGPMIGEGHFNEFLVPYYTPLLARIKEMNALTIVDTDGDVTLMVPWLEGVGVEGVLPLERQAGVDGMKLREQFPNFALIGHYDKMVMPKGEAAMRQEFERLVPLENGAYISALTTRPRPACLWNNTASTCAAE